jgi:hypothetical protein
MASAIAGAIISTSVTGHRVCASQVPGRRRRDRRQGPPISHLEFAQQGGDVTLDGTDGDEQPGADLGVGQMLTQRGQHLGLPG